MNQEVLEEYKPFFDRCGELRTIIQNDLRHKPTEDTNRLLDIVSVLERRFTAIIEAAA